MNKTQEPRGFEWALTQLRQGHLVQRSGWNGKGMYVVLQKGYPEGIPINENTAQATGIQKGTVCRFLPYLLLKTAGGNILPPAFIPWIPSQSDLLSFDWEYHPTLTEVQVG